VRLPTTARTCGDLFVAALLVAGRFDFVNTDSGGLTLAEMMQRGFDDN